MLASTRILRASWSSTLRLPKSSFPPRPLPAANGDYLRQCTDGFYAWQQSPHRVLNASQQKGPLNWHGYVSQTFKEAESGKRPTETFTLHDGPPYANGPLHIGHALNKITKDVICRFQVSQGKKVSYIPGWDCHGLPIEIKALQVQKRDSAAQMDPVIVREAAYELATQTVESQKQGFKEWAIMADWDNAYKTMDHDFELRQLAVFKTMFDKGLIYRQKKPVYWSPSSRTALAEAELEYDEEHQSIAAFVRFPLDVDESLRKETLGGVEGDISAIIWTTTPWTLPANKAIAVHKDVEYCLVRDSEEGNELALMAASRVSNYEKIIGRKLDSIQSGLRGSDLAGHLQYLNPFQKAKGLQPIIEADFVTDSSGTGLVHLAPGHGMDDYNVCSALEIPAFAPVDDTGAFTKDAFPEHPELLEGLLVSDIQRTGSQAVCKYLKTLGLLCCKYNYRHKYPIDWRTKQPVIIRATEQWFADVQGIKDASMRAISDVNFLPESGRSRLESFVQGRSQWCISRQRAWGVPIPALYKTNDPTRTAHMDSKSIQHIIDVIAERGVDAWWTDAEIDPVWEPEHFSGFYVRGRDTMDVWFDSGTSWTLLPSKPDQPVADVYFEGTDQHRGWFQSSLLTCVASQPYSTEAVKAPYKTLITHGFTLDSEGRKMSKALGNVISPSQIMSGELLPPIKRKRLKGKDPNHVQNTYDAMGCDALRLWAASSDYTRDITIGQPVLHSIHIALHKYRVTFKWLLGIFSLPTCPPPFSSFNDLNTLEPDAHIFPELTDRLAMHRLVQVSKEVHEHYTKYEFFKGINTINKYISNDLSAFYFETLKDRVYTGEKEDCQTLQRVLALIFYELLQMLAPICPILVEEVWHHVPPALLKESIHPARAVWQPLPQPTDAATSSFDAMTQIISDLDVAIKAAQERLRADKKIGSGLETAVSLYLSDSAVTNLASTFTTCLSPNIPPSNALESQLAGIFVVSEVNVCVHAGGEIEDESKKTWPWCEMETIQDSQITTLDGARVLVHPATRQKCPRCWRFVKEERYQLCVRCEKVVEHLDEDHAL